VPDKEALLKLLYRKFSHKTKEQLLAHVLCGEVYVDGEKCIDPKAPVSGTCALRITVPNRFVSRGGEKLDAVLDVWNINVTAKTMLDAGSSTGGFTDCLLKRGAGLVYAVDVGINQLDYSLRRDGRVKAMERVNLTGLHAGDFPVPPDAAVMDLAFRSVRGAAAHLLPLLSERWIIALIKPQFEWRHPTPEFDGVIRDKRHYVSILTSLVSALRQEQVYVHRAAVSALTGRKGNREFFFLLGSGPSTAEEAIISEIDRLVRDL
jgi:23S rRNA (cytidine1920-2'-O)/16S rRNA (cytidine1409-2'-O)-methyltransferase